MCVPDVWGGGGRRLICLLCPVGLPQTWAQRQALPRKDPSGWGMDRGGDQVGRVQDPEKRGLSLEGGLGGPYHSLQGCPGAEGAGRGQRTVGDPEDRPVATYWECHRGVPCSWWGVADH